MNIARPTEIGPLDRQITYVDVFYASPGTRRSKRKFDRVSGSPDIKLTI